MKAGHLFLNNGDVVILKYPSVLSKEAYKNVISSMEDLYKHLRVDFVKTIILEEGMDIQILKKGEK